MHTRSRIPVILALGILVMVAPLRPATAQQEPLPMLNAKIVAVEGAARTFQVVDMDGQVVEFTVPSKASGDIQFSRATADSEMVDVTVQSINRRTNYVRVVTEVGQTVLLQMDPMDVLQLQVDEQFTLVTPRTPTS